ncbi:MAG: hypothetical protein LBB18_03185 [Puniceicoccales bacterium]|jgi:hypothetical protein|nr:hypothetical protein [Puniceicoccales bacterium]
MPVQRLPLLSQKNGQKNLELKRVIATSAEKKPRFDWKRLVESMDSCFCEYYGIGEIAEEIS